MLMGALEDAAITGEFKISEQQEQRRKSDDVTAQIAKEERKLARIKDAYENEVYTLEEYKSSRTEIMKRIEQLREKLLTKSVPDRKKIIQSKLTTLLPALRSPATSESQKNALLKSVVESIIFYRATGGIDVFFYA